MLMANEFSVGTSIGYVFIIQYLILMVFRRKIE